MTGRPRAARGVRRGAGVAIALGAVGLAVLAVLAGASSAEGDLQPSTREDRLPYELRELWFQDETVLKPCLVRHGLRIAPHRFEPTSEGWYVGSSAEWAGDRWVAAGPGGRARMTEALEECGRAVSWLR